MDDTISRQAAIDEIEKTIKINDSIHYEMKYWKDGMECAENIIENLPSAQPKPQWIPCSERLPEHDDFVIVTILDERGDTPYRYSDFGWYFDRARCWIIDAEERTDVIAWMPLPIPYIV